MRLDEIELNTPVILGCQHFTLEAIIAFARDFDPQPFHVDEVAAAASPYGGIIASGWHTASTWMRLMTDHRARSGDLAGISPGINALNWLKPVRPGDDITYSKEVTAKRTLASRPGWAVLSIIGRGVNQAGEEVFNFNGPVFVPVEP